ncbi:MAG: hypothetical protein Hens3KO_21720 [Henriciella sp.]
MGNRAVNHHIVPEVLQRQFAVEGDVKRIWRAKRDGSGAYLRPEKKPTEKAFVIRDYNTILENDKRSDLIEREFYGSIDDFLGRLLPKVIAAFKAGEIPSFDQETLNSIRTVAMHMAKRTPDFLKDNNDTERGRELVEANLDSLSKNAPSEQRRTLEDNLADDVKLRDQGRHIRVLATLKNSRQVNEALLEFVPRWAISETRHSYILSSRMVYRIGNGGPNGLSNPKMEMWMPITPKISLVLLRDPHNEIPHFVREGPEHIRKVNEFAVKSSFEIASHSEALLKSLTRR